MGEDGLPGGEIRAKRVWERSDPFPENEFGLSSSVSRSAKRAGTPFLSY